MNSPRPYLPNATPLLIQECWNDDLLEPRASSSTADMQIRLPGTRTSMPPLAGLAVVRRAASSGPRRRGMPLGEPPPSPEPARVCSSPPGRRRKETKQNRRSRIDRTACTSPYRFGPSRSLASGPRLAGGLTMFFPRAAGVLGQPAPDQPSPARSGLCSIFF
jgi:hypothetical protein